MSSVFFCQVLFSPFPTTGFVKPLLPQVPLAPGDLLQHHQPYVAPPSFSGRRGGYLQHSQCPPQHTHSDGRVITPNPNAAAQHDKRAYPFAHLSQRPWREASPLSLLIISKCPIDEVNHVLCIKVMQKSFIHPRHNMTHWNMMMMKVNDNIYIISTLLFLYLWHLWHFPLCLTVKYILLDNSFIIF